MFTVSGPYLSTDITHPYTEIVGWSCFLPPVMFPLAWGGSSPPLCTVLPHMTIFCVLPVVAQSVDCWGFACLRLPCVLAFCSSELWPLVFWHFYASWQGAIPSRTASCPEGVSLLELDTQGLLCGATRSGSKPLLTIVDLFDLKTTDCSSSSLQCAFHTVPHPRQSD